MNAITIIVSAGLVGSATIAGLVQPAQQPSQPAPKQPTPSPRLNPGAPSTNPRTPVQPTQTPSVDPTTGQPLSNPNGDGLPNNNALTPSDLAARRRFFALDNPQTEARLTETGQKLMRVEAQFSEGNQKLLKQLGQARMMTGDRRAEAMGDVMQQLLQQQVALQQYLVDLRTSMTGDLTGQPDTAVPGSLDNALPDANRPDALTPTTNPATVTPPGQSTPPAAPRQTPGSPPSPAGPPR